MSSIAAPRPAPSPLATPAWLPVAALGILGSCDSFGSSGNRPPSAVVSAPALVGIGMVVEIDGTRSSDPEGAPLAFHWLLVSKPAGSAAALQPSNERAFLQPDQPGTYDIRLVVNDGEQDSAPATTAIEATGDPVLGAWQTTTSLAGFSTNGAHDSAAFAWNGFMYLTGGQYGSRDRIQRAPIHADGTLGAWVDMLGLAQPAMLPAANQDHLALVHRPPAAPQALVYVVGGWNGGALADVYHAPIHADGSIGSWTAGPRLNRGRHGHGGAIVGNRLYVFGGWSSGAQDGVEYADIAGDGSLTGAGATFHTATALPQALAFPAGAAEVGSPHPGPWVLGGENPAACPNTAQATVYRAAGGPATSWQPAGTLPEPLLDLGVAFTRNTFIVTGGAHRSYEPNATSCPWKDAEIRSAVYLASVDAQGNLGAWRSGPGLPAPRADHSVVLYGGYLYVLGGRSVALDPPYPTAVWFARVW